MSNQISINNLNITDNINYLVEEITFRDMPARNLTSVPISTRPGDKLVAAEWSNKQIYIKGRIFGASYDDLRSKVDTFQLNAAIQSLALQIDNDRTYTTSLIDLKIPNQFYNLTMVEYEANFLCLDPFAYASAVTISGTTISGTVTYSGTVTISGTVFAEPLLTITPAGSPSGDSGIKQMQIKYINDGGIVTISGLSGGNFNYNSPIVIDYSNYKVTVGGVTADYTGIFSRWEPGLRNFEITVISGLKNAFNIQLGYNPRYYE